MTCWFEFAQLYNTTSPFPQGQSKSIRRRDDCPSSCPCHNTVLWTNTNCFLLSVILHCGSFFLFGWYVISVHTWFSWCSLFRRTCPPSSVFTTYERGVSACSVTTPGKASVVSIGPSAAQLEIDHTRVVG
ncbi:hypothetical protein EMCRGX_G027909 [Ephydatia muelleri]